jgi:hypothetical protein
LFSRNPNRHNLDSISNEEDSTMGAVEDAVDAAANFIGPFVDNGGRERSKAADEFEAIDPIHQALTHLRAINTADLGADPNAPYDASLAGVVYGLLDLITSSGILPFLSPGVAFAQRPRSVLIHPCPLPSTRNGSNLCQIINELLPIVEQEGSGVQPLLNQRILPDIIAALAELSYSPMYREYHHVFLPVYDGVVQKTPTSRLLPILTTFLQQPLPTWLKPLMSKQLALIPLRQRGIRHTIEFLSLSYLTKNSQVPEDASGSHSQIPIPLEAVTQASRLLVLPPTGVEQNEWLRRLAPQLWTLLDGEEGMDLSRVAGQIIAGGILSKRATGAPDAIGWQLFAQPLIRSICPAAPANGSSGQEEDSQVLVQEQDLEIALKRLSVVAVSYDHAGLLRRLLGPVLLSVWALLNYSQDRPALNKKWYLLSKSILCRYLAISCNPNQIDIIATNLFWDGEEGWTFKPGAHGGVEIRERTVEDHGVSDMDNVLTRIEGLDSRIGSLVTLLAEAKTPNDAIASIFLQATRRWLFPMQGTKSPLAQDLDTDPFVILSDAKLSEAMGNRFRDQFAKSPQHIIELMGQLLSNFVSGHQARVQKYGQRNKPSRAKLRNMTRSDSGATAMAEDDTTEEELVSFAISTMTTLVSSADFKQTPETRTTLASAIAPLVYLSQEQPGVPIPSVVMNSASSLLELLQPSPALMQTHASDPVTEHRATLKTIITDLTAPEPPNRTWALNTLHKLIKDPIAFPVIDIPSMTHLLLSASLADPESYVHISAMPVLVDLAVRTPNPTIRILIDAFVDVDERSLNLNRGKRTDEIDRELLEALDFRLRVGEVLNSFVLDDSFFDSQADAPTRYRCVKQISEACLSLASRRGNRMQTLTTRTQVAQVERATQEEAEAAWGGPIPNLLDPEGEDTQDQADRDALLKIVQGWEDTGIEEDVRMRASALSVLSAIFEHRLTFLRQVTVDAGLQMVLFILTMETTEAKSLLRRAAAMIVMGLLRGLDSLSEAGGEPSVGLGMTQQNEVERVLKWVAAEDADALVRDHAASVLEGLDTWRMNKLYQVRYQGLALGTGLGLEGGLRGLAVQPEVKQRSNERRKLIVEELE